jgi:hypothetical protein
MPFIRYEYREPREDDEGCRGRTPAVDDMDTAAAAPPPPPPPRELAEDEEWEPDIVTVDEDEEGAARKKLARKSAGAVGMLSGC